jgi:phosphohistidine phosphatase
MKDGSSSRDRRTRGAHKTLWLLRHAKAVPADGLDDSDRPLDERGRRAAAHMGRHLAQRGVRPDLVLCSPSARTRETLELVGAALGRALSTRFEDALYLAGEDALLERLEGVSDDVASVMLVGHNPGIAELALQLAKRGDSEALAALHRKYPTGALAELRVGAPHWSRLGRGCELLSFVTPKRLDT